MTNGIPKLTCAAVAVSLLVNAVSVARAEVGYFTFRYWKMDSNEPEQAKVQVFTTNVPGSQIPNALLFDSAWVSTGPTACSPLVFLDEIPKAPPRESRPTEAQNSSGWTVQLPNREPVVSKGVGSQESPVDGLYHKYGDDNNGAAGWQYRPAGASNDNLAAQISMVPEPSVVALGLLGGLSVWFLRSRRNRT